MMKTEAKAILAKNLRILFSEKGWDDKPPYQLAQLMNEFLNGRERISRETLRSWMTEKTLPSYRIFQLLTDWLDCDAEDLLPAEYRQYLSGYTGH